MVMSNQTPNAAGEQSLPDLLKMFGLPQPAACPPGPAPADDPVLIAGLSRAYQLGADALARKLNCGCARCKLLEYDTKVSTFMVRETLRAAFTGDTSKLEALAKLVDEMKTGGPA